MSSHDRGREAEQRDPPPQRPPEIKTAERKKGFSR